MKQYKVFVIANLIFGILLIALTKVILPVCGNGAMRCGTSTTIDAVLGLALLVIAVFAAGLPKKKAHIVFSAIAFVVGVFVSLVPTVIVGTCPHAHMACHAVTAPVLAVFGALIALFATLNLIYLKLRRRNEQD
ncbi:DUF4418 family protein [Fibrobacter sp.]|uniref:DUF4418 family protein n=1 Tax=Fibrobacter sp. TaxID=35828 RepID=UPI0026086D12|nr:DUF4418 family protein [Fibrobacter sp.]MDD5942245.1 DUF4418 family protein [Fibrobacter sp.]